MLSERLFLRMRVSGIFLFGQLHEAIRPRYLNSLIIKPLLVLCVLLSCLVCEDGEQANLPTKTWVEY